MIGHVIRDLYIGNHASSYIIKTWHLEARPRIYPRNHPGKERAWFCCCCSFYGKKWNLHSPPRHISGHYTASHGSIFFTVLVKSYAKTSSTSISNLMPIVQGVLELHDEIQTWPKGEFGTVCENARNQRASLNSHYSGSRWPTDLRIWEDIRPVIPKCTSSFLSIGLGMLEIAVEGARPIHAISSRVQPKA